MFLRDNALNIIEKWIWKLIINSNIKLELMVNKWLIRETLKLMNLTCVVQWIYNLKCQLQTRKVQYVYFGFGWNTIRKDRMLHATLGVIVSIC